MRYLPSETSDSAVFHLKKSGSLCIAKQYSTPAERRKKAAFSKVSSVLCDKSHPVRYLPSETNDSSTFHLEVSDEVFERANVKQPRRNAAKKLPSTGWANRIIRSFGSQPKRKSTKSNQRFRPKLSIPPQGNNPHAKARRRKEIFATRTLRLCAFA